MKPPLTLDGPRLGGAEALNRPLPKAKSGGSDAAQQFEQIFLRKMLGSLMKTTKMGAESTMAGSDMYDTMVVDALSSSISDGGGIGLASVIQDRIDGRSSARGPLPGDVRGDELEATPGDLLPRQSKEPYLPLSSATPAAIPLSRSSASGPGARLEIPSSISSLDRLSGVEAIVADDPPTPRRIR
jgi:Rod binding domain-containing protein